ncbi:MAG: tetratricopeptide repeat protein, partial [Chloroflexi bacterium]|nr:tetratricopeptide repeat protein [Chloroflexota bacterium]
QEYIANRLGNLGIVASAKGDYDGALQLYQQAIVIDEELGNTQSVARHIGNMGIEYHRKRDYQAAVTRFFKALVIEQAMGNVRAEARLLGNCGAVYQDVGDFALAERCLALALQMDLAAGHRDAVARHSGNLALVFLRQGLWEQVERWVQPAITLMRQLHDLAHLVEYLLPAVQLALHDNRFTAAEQFLHECLSLLEQQNRPDIHLPAAILLLETQARQQTMPVTAVIKQLRTLLSDWPEAKDQAILYDAIWKLDPRQDEARDKAAQFYAAEHTRFPHVLYRQRYQILTGIELPPPPLPPPPGALPARPDLDELNRQLNDLAAAHANAHGRLLD